MHSYVHTYIAHSRACSFLGNLYNLYSFKYLLSGCYDMTPSEKNMYVTYAYDIMFERSFPEISETQME